MRKPGKYEAIPAPKPAKDKKANSSLLKTYMTSLLSLALCVTMFLSTTMAWFTDEVGNRGNQIKTGNLKVGLDLKTGDTPVNLAENTTTKIFDESVVWKPGSLEVRQFVLKNEGDMPFHYSLDAQLQDASGNRILNEDPNTAKYELASYFDVYCSTAQNLTVPTTIDEITAENSAWTPVGTLKDVLQDGIICKGDMNDVANTTASPATIPEKQMAIAVYMRPETPSDYIGKSIDNIYIYLTAYQNVGDGRMLTPVNNAADLAKALKDGAQTIVLSNNIDVGSMKLEVPAGKDVVLNLNGKTLTGSIAQNNAMFEVKGNLTLESGKVTVTGAGRIAKVSGSGTLTISSGVYTADDTAFYIEPSAKVEINGGSVKALTVSCGNGALTINGGTVTASDAVSNSDGKLIINGGTVTAKTVSTGNGTLTINDGHIIGTDTKTIRGENKIVVVIDCENVTITGGTFEPENRVYLTNKVTNKDGINSALGITVEEETQSTGE